jgi:hypothetical protein
MQYSKQEIIEALEATGRPWTAFFVLALNGIEHGVVAFDGEHGLMARIIENDELYAATKSFLAFEGNIRKSI